MWCLNDVNWLYEDLRLCVMLGLDSVTRDWIANNQWVQHICNSILRVFSNFYHILRSSPRRLLTFLSKIKIKKIVNKINVNRLDWEIERTKKKQKNYVSFSVTFSLCFVIVLYSFLTVLMLYHGEKPGHSSQCRAKENDNVCNLSVMILN